MHLLLCIESIEGRKCHLKLSIVFYWCYGKSMLKLHYLAGNSQGMYHKACILCEYTLWIYCYTLALSFPSVRKFSQTLVFTHTTWGEHMKTDSIFSHF